VLTFKKKSVAKRLKCSFSDSLTSSNSDIVRHLDFSWYYLDAVYAVYISSTFTHGHDFNWFTVRTLHKPLIVTAVYYLDISKNWVMTPLIPIPLNYNGYFRPINPMYINISLNSSPQCVFINVSSITLFILVRFLVVVTGTHNNKHPVLLWNVWLAFTRREFVRHLMPLP
jgi:hypothetical protein